MPLRRLQWEEDTFGGIMRYRLVRIDRASQRKAYLDQVVALEQLHRAPVLEQITWEHMARTMGLPWLDVWLTKVERG